MKKIRSRRLTKKGRSLKNRYFTIFTKLFAIVFLLLFVASRFISPTTAEFNDIERIHGKLSVAGELWDKSSLTFKSLASGGTCEEIFAVIKNGGDGNMAGPSEYEVWWTDTGNPKKGKIVYDSGVVEPLDHGDTEKLTYDLKDNSNGAVGIYKFRAYQRPGHANKYDKRFDLWSDSITVTEDMCNTGEIQKEDHPPSTIQVNPEKSSSGTGEQRQTINGDTTTNEKIETKDPSSVKEDNKKMNNQDDSDQTEQEKETKDKVSSPEDQSSVKEDDTGKNSGKDNQDQTTSEQVNTNDGNLSQENGGGSPTVKNSPSTDQKNLAENNGQSTLQSSEKKTQTTKQDDGKSTDVKDNKTEEESGEEQNDISG